MYHKYLNIIGFKNITIAQSIILFILFSATSFAMPPRPQIVDGIAKFPTPLYNENTLPLNKNLNKPSKATDLRRAISDGTYNMLAVLIDFSDKPGQTATVFFDTLLFDNHTGTLRHYYGTVSYDRLDIVTVNLPSLIGWIEAPQEYAWYCNHQKGCGDYPQNTQKLCEDIVDVIDTLVDFSLYDNDGDDTVDAVILIHSGSGYEQTSDVDDIHSHKWNIEPRLKDNVYVYDYTIQPEYWFQPGDMTCGVFCHEVGHILGLPDLYDPDYSSRGIGVWSVMSYGSWLGPNYDGSCPAEPDAWCRLQLGFTSSIDIEEHVGSMNIGNVEETGTIYRLLSDAMSTTEYFLVENRQKLGYDEYLPGDGLLIWHIDETKLTTMLPNMNEWYPGHTINGHYGVALEQADGLYNLEQLNNSGDAGDPFPGSSSNNSFTHLSNPNSCWYNGGNSYIYLGNISSSASLMTFDFITEPFGSSTNDEEEIILPEKPFLRQNHPNPFNPITTIEIVLPEPGYVSLNIYNISGQLVHQLINEWYPAGTIKTAWDGYDKSNRKVASGTYFYEVSTDYGRETKKMTLIK